MPLALGPAVTRGARPGQRHLDDSSLIKPFVTGRTPATRPLAKRIEPPAADDSTPALAESMRHVAARLDRIAGSLRNTAPDRMLSAGGGGQDALELWITAFALGYHEGRTRPLAVDPPEGSS